MLELFKFTPWPNTIVLNDPTIKLSFWHLMLKLFKFTLITKHHNIIWSTTKLSYWNLILELFKFTSQPNTKVFLWGELFLQLGLKLNPYLNIDLKIAYCQNVYMLFVCTCISKWLACIGGSGNQEKTWKKELNVEVERFGFYVVPKLTSGIGATIDVSRFSGHAQTRRVSWSSSRWRGRKRNHSTWFHYVWNRWILES